MNSSRMSNEDMIQYCNEALAWEEFGPVDIFFFESVKKILLGECSAIEEPTEVIDDLLGIERPVNAEELAPDYDKYADEYYEEDETDLSQGSSAEKRTAESFDDEMFTDGFFDVDNEENDEDSEGCFDSPSESQEKKDDFKVNIQPD